MTTELCWDCKKVFVENPNDEEFICETCRLPETLNVFRRRYASDEELLTHRSCYHCLRATRASGRIWLSPYCTLLGRTVDFREVCDAIETAQAVTIKDRS